MTAIELDEAFPHSLTIHIPFPTKRLATSARRSLAVDEELSSLVKRDFALVSADSASTGSSDLEQSVSQLDIDNKRASILRVHYKATTPRMLRVAVNGFFESLGLVVQVMEELDVDMLHEKGIEGLEGVQGIETGMTGTAMGVGG